MLRVVSIEIDKHAAMTISITAHLYVWAMRVHIHKIIWWLTLFWVAGFWGWRLLRGFAWTCGNIHGSMIVFVQGYHQSICTLLFSTSKNLYHTEWIIGPCVCVYGTKQRNWQTGCSLLFKCCLISWCLISTVSLYTNNGAIIKVIVSKLLFCYPI